MPNHDTTKLLVTDGKPTPEIIAAFPGWNAVPWYQVFEDNYDLILISFEPPVPGPTEAELVEFYRNRLNEGGTLIYSPRNRIVRRPEPNRRETWTMQSRDRNDDRAGWAQTAARRFAHETGLDLDDERKEAVGDLLCNLGHYADRLGMDFPLTCARAIAGWIGEKNDPDLGFVLPRVQIEVDGNIAAEIRAVGKRSD